MVHGLTPEATECRPLRGLGTGTVPVTSGFSGREDAPLSHVLGSDTMGVLVTQDCECPICGRPFGDEPVFNFTFVEIEDPRLAILDDWAVHTSCLEGWELRDEFVDAWNAKAKEGLGPTWMLVEQKDGTLAFGKEPVWERVLGVVLIPVFSVAYSVRGIYCRLANVDSLTGRKRGPKCRNCGTRLFAPGTKQCLKCGMDWHDPDNVVFHKTQ